MTDITITVPDQYRDIVRLGLENSAATLWQAVKREMDAESRLPNPSEMDRWRDMIDWLSQAAEKLR